MSARQSVLSCQTALSFGKRTFPIRGRAVLDPTTEQETYAMIYKGQRNDRGISPRASLGRNDSTTGAAIRSLSAGAHIGAPLQCKGNVCLSPKTGATAWYSSARFGEQGHKKQPRSENRGCRLKLLSVPKPRRPCRGSQDQPGGQRVWSRG